MKKLLHKKGFTLVEVIVVLVILAVLIALAVPSVMKYIDDAKDSQILMSAKGVTQDVETAMIEEFAKQEATTWGEFEDAVSENLEERGYPAGNFGQSSSGTINVGKSDKWEPGVIYYMIKTDNATNIGHGANVAINYSQHPKLQQLNFTLFSNAGSRSYRYIPNQELTLTSKTDK